MSLEGESLDAILTSPPYANRTDYTDVEAILEGERITNAAFRDCLDKPAIGRSVERLLKLRGQVSASKQNEIQRSLARSMAKIGSLNEALEEATLAVETAKSLDSLRATGNSHLALGEVLRYRGDLPAAVGEYQIAASIARAIGNRDSHIWCLLGEGAADIQSGEMKAAEMACNEVEVFLREPGYIHPLEQAHLGLLRLLIGRASETDVLAQYAKLGIQWPQQFLLSRVAGGVMEPIPL